ncbi:MAG TPA: polyphenol oxidase family protein [Gemmatimonadaceae bacterium]|nr:polyphenol oxidase family protein [Gemmatimonadaceae bacterium]
MIAHEPVPELEAIGVHAFTTARDAGSFNTISTEPVAEAMTRWYQLLDDLARWSTRFATARQVHGTDVLRHFSGWQGWLRGAPADGHFAPERGTAMAVTVADCVPVFMAHPDGPSAVLHAGWRGTAGGILQRGIACFTESGLNARDLVVHLGPAICGACYEVGPDVYERLTGQSVAAPTRVDLRELLGRQAGEAGVRHVSVSPWCTRCNNERFFSHRCGDFGRQLGVIVSA